VQARTFLGFLGASLIASVAVGRDVELTAAGISVPFFDVTGRLTHRMVATHGAMVGGRQTLRQVELVYYSATNPAEIVQKVTATDAAWNAETELLTGTGDIVVATPENRITGQGFDFALATSLLHIHRDFKMENSEMVVTSDRADVELLIERAGENVQVRDVKRCEASGNLTVVVQPTAKKRYQFERAFSTVAIYQSATQQIELPEPVRYVQKGRQIETNKLTITVGHPNEPKPPATSQPKAH
jgi:hypothetical protein